MDPNSFVVSELSCWAPEQFTDNQVSFVQSVCQDQLKLILANKTGAALTQPPTKKPSPEEMKAMIKMKTMMMAKKKDEIITQVKNKIAIVKEKMMKEYKIFFFISLEILVACLAYVLVLVVTSLAASKGHLIRVFVTYDGQASMADGHEESLVKKSGVTANDLSGLAKTRGMAISYFLILVLAAVAFLELAVMCNTHCQPPSPDMEKLDAAIDAKLEAAMSGKPTDSSKQGNFNCDITINSLTSPTKYSIQCHYRVSMSPTSDMENIAAMTDMEDVSPLVGISVLAVKVNVLLCILLAVISIIHLFNMFMLAPCSSKQHVFTYLQMHGIKPPQCATYAFTNLSMVATFSNLNLKGPFDNQKSGKLAYVEAVEMKPKKPSVRQTQGTVHS